MFDQCGLSSAVFTHQAENHALRDYQIDLSQGGGIAKSTGKIADLDTVDLFFKRHACSPFPTVLV